jgi:hypothetical protein
MVNARAISKGARARFMGKNGGARYITAEREREMKNKSERHDRAISPLIKP